MNTLGKTSKTTFLIIESHKLSQEFTATAAIKRGQPVKLVAADGSVVPWAKADGIHLLVGYAYSDAANGEYVTVFCRGFIVLFGLSTAALNCGICTWASYDSATALATGEDPGWNKFDTTALVTETIGWNLTPAAGANTLIRVLLMD